MIVSQAKKEPSAFSLKAIEMILFSLMIVNEEKKATLIQILQFLSLGYRQWKDIFEWIWN
jgi:hypothetical protein